MHHPPGKLLCAAAALLSLVAGAHGKPPNIVFILADDQSWNGTSVPMMPGKEFSKSQQFHPPNIERLAAQGMAFPQAYAGHPKCECSRAALERGEVPQGRGGGGWPPRRPAPRE